jgi:hypothetical protein
LRFGTGFVECRPLETNLPSLFRLRFFTIHLRCLTTQP